MWTTFPTMAAIRVALSPPAISWKLVWRAKAHNTNKIRSVSVAWWVMHSWYLLSDDWWFSSWKKCQHIILSLTYTLHMLQVHGLSLGAVRGGVPRHLHRQPRRLHDHQGGVDWVLGRRRYQGELHHHHHHHHVIIIVQLSNPQSLKPPLKFGTVPWTYTDNALRKHYPSMHLHMKQYNERDVREGVNSVKRGWGSFTWTVNENPRKFSQYSEKERSWAKILKDPHKRWSLLTKRPSSKFWKSLNFVDSKFIFALQIHFEI